MLHCLENIASYMEALPMDVPSNLWTGICSHFQTFLTKLPAVLPLKVTLDSVADSSMTATVCAIWVLTVFVHFEKTCKSQGIWKWQIPGLETQITRKSAKTYLFIYLFFNHSFLYRDSLHYCTFYTENVNAPNLAKRIISIGSLPARRNIAVIPDNYKLSLTKLKLQSTL